MDRRIIHRGARVSWEQRQGLMEYMQAHEDLARAKIAGPDAFRVKRAMLEELATILNAMDSGAAKPPEKWYKCWTSWKCDVKAKALRIKQCKLSTVNGLAPPPLTALEKLVLQYCEEETVQGLTAMDPLEESSSNHELLSAIDEKSDESKLMDAELDQPWSHTSPSAGHNQANYSLIDGVQRQAAAIEKMGSGLHKMAAGVATSVKSVPTALMAIAAAIETQPEISHQTNIDNDDIGALSSLDVQDAKHAPKPYQENQEVTRRKRRCTVLTLADGKTTSNIKYLQNNNPNSYDATELIFLGYAKSIKALSIRRQARIKMKIAKMIVEEEVAQFEEENSPEHLGNTPSSPYATVKIENSNDSSLDGF